MRTWTTKSSSGSGTYTTVLADDGLLSCDCRGWTFKRGAFRECKHTKKVIKDLKAETRVIGEHVYVVLAGVTLPETEVEQPVAEEVVDPDPIPDPMRAVGMTQNILAGTLTDEVFAKHWGTGDWTMDEKLDGQRVVVRKRDGVIKKIGAANVLLPPHIIAEIAKLPDCTIDGELHIKGMVGTDVPNILYRDILQLTVFDILEVEGKSTLALAFMERRGLLLAIISGHDCIAPHLAVVRQAKASLQTAKDLMATGGEGVILKRKDSTYQPGERSTDWVKLKRLEAHTVTVTGFEPGLRGPTTRVTFVYDDGVEGITAVLTNKELAATAANPESYIGRKLVIQCQQRHKSGAAMQPRMVGWAKVEFDHFAGKGE